MSARTAESLNRLLREEAALRRVAMLVAEGAPQSAVFEAVAAEASSLLAPAQVRVVPAEDAADPDQAVARVARETGAWTATGIPVVVDGSPCGALVVVSSAAASPGSGSETLLAGFAQLTASAIVSVRARDELRSLAESHEALRRVATLVAQGAEPRAVFTAVAVEASRLLGVGAVSLISYDADRQLFTKIYGTHGQRSAVPDGDTWFPEDSPVEALVVQTGQPARVDDWTGLPGPVAARHREQGFGQAVATPIIIDGALWGLISAFGEAGQILPAGCELRLADYTQLMASAIANVQARDELRGLAERQGEALRRVATLVAQRASPSTIFNAVAGEASRALGVTRVDVARCHADGSVTFLGSTGTSRPGDNVFTWSVGYVARRVMETGCAARVDDWTTLPVPEAQAASQEGFQSAVGAPIVVDDTLWGVIVVLADEILPGNAETRLIDFTHLVAGSISNVHARDSLIASRARIITVSDETRRRIERNLHDGIQQRMVGLAFSIRAVRTGSPLPDEVGAKLDKAARDLDRVLEEIRVFSKGLHPALLSRAGLGPSLRELGRRSPIAVELDIEQLPRMPEPIEIAVYYVVSEALANAAKHSRATVVSVAVGSDPACVRATVSDDGVGGATLGRGSGLIGLVDRIETIGGRFRLDSPAEHGTTISIELPLDFQPRDERPGGAITRGFRPAPG